MNRKWNLEIGCKRKSCKPESTTGMTFEKIVSVTSHSWPLIAQTWLINYQFGNHKRNFSPSKVGFVVPMVIRTEFHMKQYRDDDHREQALYFMMDKLMLVTDMSDYFCRKNAYIVGYKKKRDSGLNSVTNISVDKKLKMKRLTGSPPTSNNLSKS